MSTTHIVAKPGQPSITMTREFSAPAQVVLRAYTEPELVTKWLGPAEMAMHIDYFEARDGGRYRYTHRGDDGVEYGFHGVFHGTPSVEDGIVQTFEFEGMPGHVAFDTVTFAELDGKTTVTTQSLFQIQEARDGMLASGMEHGVNEAYDKLDQLLAGLLVSA